MSVPSFFWYDYETSGLDPARDRPMQFAGIRTSLDLEETAEPVNLFCKLPADCLPQPKAVLLTHISPLQCAREGLLESEFARRVYRELGMPGTCGVGYNTLSFDDEVGRHLFYRNFLSPYGREWQHGNSRWDLLKVVRTYYATRPSCLFWPEQDGKASLKLEHLATANGLEQERAHDALSDVHACIALARRLRNADPVLWEHLWMLRKKDAAQKLVHASLLKPLLLTDTAFGLERRYCGLVAPLLLHGTHEGPAPNQAWCWSLEQDPALLLEGTEEEIVAVMRGTTPDEGTYLPPSLLRLTTNRLPQLLPPGEIKNTPHVDGGTLDTARRHLAWLRTHEHAWRSRLQRIVAAQQKTHDPAPDPELALYGAFLSKEDTRRCELIQQSAPESLKDLHLAFDNPGLETLLFRYRARQWPDTLDSEERQRWMRFLHDKLEGREGEPHPLTTLTLEAFCTEVSHLAPTTPDEENLKQDMLVWAQGQHRLSSDQKRSPLSP